MAAKSISTSVALLLFYCTKAWATASLGVNLIDNPDAEAGVLIGTNTQIKGQSYGIYSTPGWTVTSGGFQSSAYADTSAPNISPSSPGPPNRGSLFFFGGNSGNSSATQLIDLSSLADNIATGNDVFSLSGWFGGYYNQGDNATCTVEFLNASQAPVGSAIIGPVTEAQRGGVSSLLFQQTQGTIPTNAAYALVTQNMTIVNGTTNNAIADNLSLVVTDGVQWAQPSNGNWSTASSWSPVLVPTASTDVNFNTGSVTPYAVNLTNSSAASNLSVQGDDVTIVAGTHSLSIAGSLTLADVTSPAGSLTISGGSVSATNGIGVGSQKYVGAMSASAALTTQNTLVISNITNFGRLTTLQNSYIAGNVVNNGDLHTFSATTGAQPGNILTISGNYTQSTTGTLAIQVSGGVGGSKYDQLNILGMATFAGTLDVTVNGFLPGVGDTMPIITYGSLASRFTTFNGSVIKGTDGNPIAAASNEFFGLLYGANTLTLATLQVPQRATGGSLTSQGAGATGLILLTHGWNSSVATWPTQTAIGIQASNAQRGVAAKWDVVTMDWSQFNSFLSGPRSAAVNANDIGESIANWMREKNVFDYQNIHLIGHSAGAWLGNGITNGLRNQGSSAFIQETFLDAYNPAHFYFGLNGYAANNMPNLGSNANYAEQYYDSQNLLLPGLDSALPDAVNYDVVGLKTYITYTPIGVHQWPYVWYGNTVLFPNGTDSGNGFGFGQAIEYTGKQPHFAPGSMGERISLPSGFFYNTTQFNQAIDLLGITHVTSGTVQSGGQGIVQLSASSSFQAAMVTATTSSITPAISSTPSASPAILTDQIVLSSMESLLSFDGIFLSSGHGLLTVYFDGVEITQVDELDVGTDPWVGNDLYLGSDIQPGIHTLMFRLDAFDGLSSTVNVEDVAFGVGTFSVPEPTFGAFMACLGAMVIYRRK